MNDTVKSNLDYLFLWLSIGEDKPKETEPDGSDNTDGV
jgi:hypothetical protein